MRPSPVRIYALPIALWALILACTLPELALLGADLGLWGTIRWRPDSYAYGAFWAGLLKGWLPNYPFQSYVMFVTYAFLHGGPGHLLVNMAALVIFGRPMIARIGTGAFLQLYLFCLLGGAVGFALLTNTLQPMVGASGALFGLVAASLFATMQGNHPDSRPPLSAWVKLVAILILLNLGSYLLAAGHLAWETHLGGTVAGLILAPLYRR